MYSLRARLSLFFLFSVFFLFFFFTISRKSRLLSRIHTRVTTKASSLAAEDLLSQHKSDPSTLKNLIQITHLTLSLYSFLYSSLFILTLALSHVLSFFLSATCRAYYNNESIKMFLWRCLMRITKAGLSRTNRTARLFCKLYYNRDEFDMLSISLISIRRMSLLYSVFVYVYVSKMCRARSRKRIFAYACVFFYITLNLYASARIQNVDLGWWHRCFNKPRYPYFHRYSRRWNATIMPHFETRCIHETRSSIFVSIFEINSEYLISHCNIFLQKSIDDHQGK